MTVSEIFGSIIKHMIEGFMIHEELANYYDFLNLKGYKRCHEYHYYCESKAYRKLYSYYVNHYNKLVQHDDPEAPHSIPMNWFNHERKDVDVSTKRSAVKTAVEAWVSWESETKDFYQKMFSELMKIDEIASAKKVMCLICDVNKELKMAENRLLTLKTVDYDISYILQEQHALHAKFKAKINE